MNPELELYMKESFSNKLISATETAIKFKFPNIQNLEVCFDKDYNVVVIFDEGGGITQTDVELFLDNLKKQTIK